MSQESMSDAPVVQPGHSRRNFIKGVIAATILATVTRLVGSVIQDREELNTERLGATNRDSGARRKAGLERSFKSKTRPVAT